jgi:hypothetical protein
VKEALGNMENLDFWQSHSFKRQMKIVQRRLIGFCLLRRDHPIKLHL